MLVVSTLDRPRRALLASFPSEAARTRAFYLLSEVTLELLRARDGGSLDDLVNEIALHLARAGLPARARRPARLLLPRRHHQRRRRRR